MCLTRLSRTNCTLTTPTSWKQVDGNGQVQGSGRTSNGSHGRPDQACRRSWLRVEVFRQNLLRGPKTLSMLEMLVCEGCMGLHAIFGQILKLSGEHHAGRGCWKNQLHILAHASVNLQSFIHQLEDFHDQGRRQLLVHCENMQLIARSSAQGIFAPTVLGGQEADG